MTPLQALQAKYGLTVLLDGDRLVIRPEPQDKRLREGIERNRERIMSELRKRWSEADQQLANTVMALEAGFLGSERAFRECLRIARQAAARFVIQEPCKRCRGRLWWRLPEDRPDAPLICYKCAPPPDHVVPRMFESIVDEQVSRPTAARGCRQ